MGMTNRKTKTIRLVVSEELYDKIKAQADEDFRTVPKQIIQLLKLEFGMLGSRKEQ